MTPPALPAPPSEPSLVAHTAFRKPVAGPVPLYHQIELNLRERIKANEFEPDTPLPPEDVLAREYEVSRETLRRALDVLIRHRLIVRRRGVGTFVARTLPARKQITLVGRLDDAFLHMENFSYRVLSREQLALGKADAAVVEALQLSPPSTHVDRLEMVALTANQPYAYSEFYFPQDIGAKLSTQELGGSIPVLRVVEARTHETVSYADQTVEPALASTAVAHHLGIDAHRPILQMRRTYFTPAGRPVESVVVRYHPDRFTYSAHLVAEP